MAKITDMAARSYAETHEQRRRQKGDRDAARNQEADAIYRKDLWSIGLPIVGLFGLLFLIVKFDDLLSPAAIGLLFVLSIALYLIAFVLGTIVTLATIGAIVVKNRWRRRQGDRILNLREDEREQLVHYAFGGENLLMCRYIVLNKEVRDWAEQAGVKMTVLTTYRKQGDIPLVWFRKPEQAVAFKMRWY